MAQDDTLMMASRGSSIVGSGTWLSQRMSCLPCQRRALIGKSPASVFENAAGVVAPDLCAALRQLLLTRLLPCGRVDGVRAISFLGFAAAAELQEIMPLGRNHRRAVVWTRPGLMNHTAPAAPSGNPDKAARTSHNPWGEFIRPCSPASTAWANKFAPTLATLRQPLRGPRGRACATRSHDYTCGRAVAAQPLPGRTEA